MPDLTQVVARFYVQRMEKYAGQGSQRTFHLSPVTRGTENKTWAAATPSGSIQLTVGNESAADWFESMLGKDVAITFEARPMLCVKCKGEMVMDQYASNYDQLGDGSVQHRACPPPRFGPLE